MSEYRARKHRFGKEIWTLDLYFDNGDVIHISGKEVVSMDVTMYDRLIAFRWKFCPVAKSGSIKLRIKGGSSFGIRSSHVESSKEFRRDRKSYLYKRFLEQGGSCAIRVTDLETDGSFFCAHAKARQEGELLVLEFLGEREESADREEHNIQLGNICKNEIERIAIIFENGDEFSVFPSEIADMRLTFSSELLKETFFFRSIESGYLKIVLDRDIAPHERKYDFYKAPKKKKKFIKFLKSRICSEGKCVHDIAWLNVHFKYPYAVLMPNEMLNVKDHRDPEVVEALEARERETGGRDWYVFEGGCSEELEDGNILISFGRTAVNRLQAQTEGR